MRLGEVLGVAWEGLITNKVRALLTMLGVIIGVAAVIIMMAVSAGTEATIAEQINSLGANLVFVSSAMTRMAPGQGGAQGGLTYDDAEAIEEQIVNVVGFSVEQSTSQTVKYGNVSLDAITVLGTSFEVNTGMQGTEVTVVNGEVLVENETGFALLSRGSYALFGKSGTPEVRKGVPADRCLEMARSVLPDASAERLFLSRFVSQPTESSSVRRQIFMVETQRRAVSAVELRWLPDPYSEGHAGYNIFVSDSALNPLFKATIAREVFQDKTRNSIRITVPPEMQEQADTRLHIDLLPDYTSGGLETSFTEVRAIGVRP